MTPTTYTYVPFGEILRARRTALGLSRSQLSFLSQVREMTITRIETGKTDEPRRSTREQLEEALDRAEAGMAT